MTQSVQEAKDRLQAMIEDVRLDALHHPDPCGASLQNLLEAIQRHVQDEISSVQTYARIGRETNDPVTDADRSDNLLGNHQPIPTQVMSNSDKDLGTDGRP